MLVDLQTIESELVRSLIVAAWRNGDVRSFHADGAFGEPFRLDPVPTGNWVITSETPTSRRQTLVPAISARRLAEHAADTDPAVDPQQRFEDVLHLATARALKVDLLVTSRPFLLQSTPSTDICVLEPAEALGVVGLFRRRRGSFPSLDGSARGFYRSLVFAILPNHAGWRHLLLATGNQARAEPADEVVGRVAQVLRARDRVLWALLDESADREDEVLYHVTLLLVALHAAFDAVAFTAEFELNLGSRSVSVGWRHAAWRDQLPASMRRVIHDDRWRGAFDAVRLLRNTVHAPAIDSSSFQNAGDPAEVVVDIPAAIADVVEPHLSALGVELMRFGSEFRLLRPAELVEGLVREAAALIDTLLSEIARCSVRTREPRPDWEHWGSEDERLLILAGLA